MSFGTDSVDQERRIIAAALWRVLTIGPVYSGFQLCPSLTRKEKCIRLREYKQGQFQELFHEHVPAHQLAEAATAQLLWTLVLRYEEATTRQIVQCYRTRRGRLAKTNHHLNITVEYPEPGVIRKYCDGNVQAWIDAVISPENFRSDS